MSPQLTVVGIAVVECQGRFLVGTRSADVPLAGLSEFPGGKVEPGETPAAAAVRECTEETGIEVEPVGEYPAHLEAYPHGRVALHFVACRPVASRRLDTPAEPRPPFRWVARADLVNLEFPAGNRTLLARLTSGA